MNVDDRHTDRVDARRAAFVDEDESARDADFEAALAERYRRLSLLTLDLAEEAGEAAVNFSLVDTRGVRPAFFDRRLAAMTRAIWAHRVIERLRGAPAAKAAFRKDDAKAASDGNPRGWRPDDGWTPSIEFNRPSRGESRVVEGEAERKASNQSPTRHGPAAKAANKKDSAKAANKEDDAKAAIIRESAPSRAGMASMSRHGDVNRMAINHSPTRHGLTMASMPASGENLADKTQLPEQRPDDGWTPRSSRGESETLVGEECQRDVGVRVETANDDEAALIDSITNDGLGLGAMIDALAEADLAADDCVGDPSPDRHGPVAAAPFPPKTPAAARPSQSGAEGVSVFDGCPEKTASGRAAGGADPP